MVGGSGRGGIVMGIVMGKMFSVILFLAIAVAVGVGVSLTGDFGAGFRGGGDF